ncbi:DivIVA domain-containing protein [Phosphitispora fastidiosa]|uniref:DivIVA domain-containing protein n=1 Tax=Phosphitispora fastidiosa TaxID=2837202 RepID=UPI001E3BFA59|nr:DivIVA domain-containing protein [Phosphitispora fastidiosa]MBU7008586.1 cell division initiation protein [Phosphitispora fastidiosa]
MTLTPLDIHNKEFRKAFRGYDEEEVDEFLDRVVKEYEVLFKENAGLKEALEAKNSDIGTYQELEQTLQKTLVIAQQTSDEMKNGARREADAVIQEARLKAEQIIAAAEEQVKNIIREYEDVRKEAQVFRVKFRSFLKSHLELIGEEEEVRFDQTLFNEAAAGEAAVTVTDKEAGIKIG